MFWKKDDNSVELAQLKSDVDRLEKEKRVVREELEDLKLKKKLESEDIKHMVKINSERKDIELEKEKIKLQKKSADEIAAVKDEYRDKTEQQLEAQVKDMKGMYSEILTRLPTFTHAVKEKREG